MLELIVRPSGHVYNDLAVVCLHHVYADLSLLYAIDTFSMNLLMLTGMLCLQDIVFLEIGWFWCIQLWTLVVEYVNHSFS